MKFSYSKLDTYARCGECFRITYVDGLRSPDTYNSALGRMVHKAIELLDEGKDWLQAMEELELPDYLESQRLLMGEETRKAIQKWEILSLELEVAGLEHEKSEHEFCLEYNTHELVGYIDKIFKDGSIGEIKCPKNRWSRETAQLSNQWKAYVWARLRETDKIPDVHYFVLPRRARKHQHFVIKPDDMDLFNFEQWVDEQIQGIEHGDFRPNIGAPFHHMACSAH